MLTTDTCRYALQTRLEESFQESIGSMGLQAGSPPTVGGSGVGLSRSLVCDGERRTRPLCAFHQGSYRSRLHFEGGFGLYVTDGDAQRLGGWSKQFIGRL